MTGARREKLMRFQRHLSRRTMEVSLAQRELLDQCGTLSQERTILFKKLISISKQLGTIS